MKIFNLVVFLIVSHSLASHADPYNHMDLRARIANQFQENDVWPEKSFHILNDVYTRINYDQEKLVITATFANSKTGENQLYGGTFSPTAAVYFKPFLKFNIKAFVQAACMDYYCNELIVSIGFKNAIGNPYAYAEPKFILSRI
jgi:hypothetical protein